MREKKRRKRSGKRRIDDDSLLGLLGESSLVELLVDSCMFPYLFLYSGIQVEIRGAQNEGTQQFKT